MLERLSQAGYKVTPVRRKIFEVFSTPTDVLSADAVWRRLRKSVDLASVHRNVRLFARLGMLFEEQRGNERYYYRAGQAHHHITCRACGATECFPCSHDFPHTFKNFSSISHQLEVSGICAACASRTLA